MNKILNSIGKRRMPKIYLAAALIFFASYGFTHYQKGGLPPGDKDNAGLYLPDGFEALAVVDSLKGFARHLTVNANGDIYVKLRYYKPGEGVNLALRDSTGDGMADIVKRF